MNRMKKRTNYSLVKKLANRELALDSFTQSPNVWTTSLIDESLEHTNCFYYKDLYGHYGCVNSVEFSPDGNFMVSGGDDKRICLWRLWEAIDNPDYQPKVMKKEHNSNIFCLSFDQHQQRIYSGGNDDLVVVHNIETGEPIDVFVHMDDVHAISVNPTNHNIFASSSNEIYIWDLRNSLSCTHLPTGHGVFHGVMYNPVNANLIVTGSSKNGIEMYDLRNPLQRVAKFYPSYILNNPATGGVRFNHNGTKILALGLNLPPVLYDVRSPYPQLLFESDGFFNLCTLKNCSFAGRDDQFVMCGSDNFYIYIWKIPDSIRNDSSKANPLKQESVEYVGQATQVLTGHRSIVNQVRFNYSNGIIASTGVEKIIKLWSPLIKFDGKNINSKSSNFAREFYSYDNLLDEIMSNSENSVQEDIRLIAYFDSMLERDIEIDSVNSDDGVESYFSRLPINYSSSGDDPNCDEIENLPSTDCNSDREMKFSIQNKFDFHRINYIGHKLDDLDLVYAQRMHVRYLSATIDNIIQQIKKIEPNLKSILEKYNFEQSLLNESDSEDDQHKTKYLKKLSKHDREIQEKSRNILFLLQNQKKALRHYNDLYENIQNKKRHRLLLRALALICELYSGLRYESLFQRPYVYERNISISEVINYLESKNKVELNARKMSQIHGRKVYDRRLYLHINSLSDKILWLAKILKANNVFMPKHSYFSTDSFLDILPSTYIHHFLRNNINLNEELSFGSSSSSFFSWEDNETDSTDHNNNEDGVNGDNADNDYQDINNVSDDGDDDDDDDDDLSDYDEEDDQINSDKRISHLLNFINGDNGEENNKNKAPNMQPQQNKQPINCDNNCNIPTDPSSLSQPSSSTAVKSDRKNSSSTNDLQSNIQFKKINNSLKRKCTRQKQQNSSQRRRHEHREKKSTSNGRNDPVKKARRS